MSSRAIVLALVVGCMVAAPFMASPARAEVYAVLGPQGEYLETRVTSAGTPGQGGESVWASQGQSESWWLVLNPEGAIRGDSRPVIAHEALTGLPTVGWSTRIGKRDRDIVVSRFDGQDWQKLPAIPGGRGIHDSEPAIAASGGTTTVAWTRKDATDGRSVWISTFDGLTWSNPARVTPEGVSAWSPAIYNSGGTFIIASITRGEPKIRFDTISVIGAMIGESPMPTPPTVSPGPGNWPPAAPPKVPGGEGSAGGEGPTEKNDISQNP